MTDTVNQIGTFLRANRFLLAFAASAVFIEIIPTLFGGYGYFIDEWYYIACAKRLAFGYVDQPPLAPLLLRGVLWIAGGSLAAIRSLPALAGGVTIFLTGSIARNFGGGKFAQGLACLTAIVAPGFLLLFGFFSVNAFEVMFWVLCWHILVGILKNDRPSGWVIFGLVFGLGLETKHTIVLLGAAIAAGLLLSPARSHFAKRQFWMGWTIALVLILPNILWQIANGWPSLEFYANATLYKNIPTPLLKGFVNQLFLENPLAFPVWLSGLSFLLFSNEGRRYRAIGWAFLVLLAVMLGSQSSRPDRIAGAYPVLFAAGGVALESFIRNNRIVWLKPVAAGLVLLGGLVFAPIGLPLLPPGILARYSAGLGIVPPLEKGKTSPLPQWFADRFDWDETVSTVAYVFHHLPPEERERAVIYAPSYGHAGALEFYGPALGLPRVICNQNNYYLWGMGKADADVLIAIDGGWRNWKRVYAQVDSVATIHGTYAMSWRMNMPVYVAQHPTVPLDSVWRRIKHYE